MTKKLPPLSTVWDVLAGSAIGLGLGAVFFGCFGVWVGAGVAVLTFGLLRAGVTIWNAR